jgi:hypothetical protein
VGLISAVGLKAPPAAGHVDRCAKRIPVLENKQNDSSSESATICLVGEWTFLTNHARVLLYISHDPDARLRDLAAGLGITERTAYGIVADLAEAGYVVKEKDGRRNRYHIQPHLPLRDGISREQTIGEVLDLLGAERPSRRARTKAPKRRG